MTLDDALAARRLYLEAVSPLLISRGWASKPHPSGIESLGPLWCQGRYNWGLSTDAALAMEIIWGRDGKPDEQ